MLVYSTNEIISLPHLITGVQVFVVSDLVDRLMEGDEEMICLDNYFRGCKANIDQRIGHPRFELILYDVSDPNQL